MVQGRLQEGIFEKMTGNRGTVVARAIKTLNFITGPAWRSYDDLAKHLGVHQKTARRWILDLELAGVPVQFTGEDGEQGRRFRRGK